MRVRQAVAGPRSQTAMRAAGRAEAQLPALLLRCRGIAVATSMWRAQGRCCMGSSCCAARCLHTLRWVAGVIDSARAGVQRALRTGNLLRKHCRRCQLLPWLQTCLPYGSS